MHIMQIYSGVGLDGANLQCLLLSELLAENGHDVTLVCHPNAVGKTRIKNARIKVVDSDLHRWPTDELRKINMVAQTTGVDIIHTHKSRAHFFGVLLRHAFRLSVPVVATAHNRQFQPHWMMNDFVIANSESTHRYHRKWNRLRQSKMQTVYYPMDTTPFDNVDSRAAGDFRKRLGAEQDTRVIGVVGFLVERKAQIDLISAMPAILDKVPNTKLVVAGNDNTPYGAKAHEVVGQLGIEDHVVFIGFMEDIPTLMRSLDLCVACPVKEPFGLTAPEAMAASCPVVATDIDGLRESVVDGETGVLVPSGDRRKIPAALADAIVTLLDDDQRRLRFGTAGRRLVERKFGVDNYIAQVEEIYLSLISSKRPRAVAA